MPEKHVRKQAKLTPEMEAKKTKPVLMTNLKKYLDVLNKIRNERGCICEGCKIPASHGHHIIPCSEIGINSSLVFEPANILILCDDCHALMHPLLRNISDWKKARKDRGQMLNRLN